LDNFPSRGGELVDGEPPKEKASPSDTLHAEFMGNGVPTMIEGVA
jgi:hypothetical protein